jgi:hypothetical protein
MVGKRVQFDHQTWQAIDAVMSRNGLTTLRESVQKRGSIFPPEEALEIPP